MASTTVPPPPAAPLPGPSAGPSKAGGLARATGLMMAMVLLSRILGVLRDSIISHFFGRGPQTDAYNAAFTVPDLLFYLLQSGALSSTIVPIITEYRQQGKQKLADKTVSIVASTIFVFIGLLIIVMWINARALTIALNPGFDQHRIDMAVPLTRVLLPAQMFFFMGGLMMGVLYSRKQFLIPALGPVIYNSFIIFGALVLRLFFPPERAIEGLVWGAIGGAFIGNFLIPFIAVNRLGVRLRPDFAVTHPAARKVWRMLLPIGLGVALPNIDQMVNKGFASFLGPGDTTAIMNAYRLMLLPIGVFAQAMSLAVFPTLSLQAAAQNIPALRRTMNQSLRNILFLTVPASALMLLLAEPVITLLLQSGKFTHEDTLATAAGLRFLALGIFAWSCQSLLTRGFYALQNSKIPVISGAIVSVLFVAMNFAVIQPVLHARAHVRALRSQAHDLDLTLNALQPFVAPALAAQNHLSVALSRMPAPDPNAPVDGPQADLEQAQTDLNQLVSSQQAALMQAQTGRDGIQAQIFATNLRMGRLARRAVEGLGLATSIAAAIHMLALYFLLRRRLRGLNSLRLGISLGKTLAATAALCLTTWVMFAAVATVLDPAHLHAKVAALIVLLTAGGIGLIAFLATARALRMPELQAGLDMLKLRAVLDKLSRIFRRRKPA